MKESSPRDRIDAPVVSVTLLEDRAQVTRRIETSLSAGAHRLMIESVTPLIADRTLNARAPQGGRVEDLRVTREWRIGTDEQPPEAAELTEKHRAVSIELETKEDGMSGLEKRRCLIEKALRLFVDNVNRQLPGAQELDESWERELDKLASTLEALDKSWMDRRSEIDDLHHELSELELRHSICERPDHHLAAELIVDVSVPDAGDYAFEIDYTVPCALWRPMHRATLVQDEVTVECEAAVWQATGEDWCDVELRFSTARPTQGSDPPVLLDDLLQQRKKRERKVSVEVRETTIATTGEGQGEVDQGLPGVDDGGETRLLDAPEPLTIDSDGRMRRVPLFSFVSEAEVDHICCPEVAPLVHLRSVQTNESSAPLLAGPLTLLRESGYVGRSMLNFVAPGERFAIGWGSEDGIRVRRELKETRDRSKLSGRQKIIRTVELFLSNLDDQPQRFKVQERIPVSEIDKVVVKLDEKETTPRPGSNDQGIYTWSVQLPEHGTKQLRLQYSLSATGAIQGL